MRREILTATELASELSKLNGWTTEENLLKKHLSFGDFAASLAFVNKVGALADAMDHHPDLTFGWGYADITLTTHDRGGVTDVDIALAAKIDSIQPDEQTNLP